MASVYILHSQKLDRFYIGQTTLSPSTRLEQHNSDHFPLQFTKSGVPWTLFLVIKCQNRTHAILVEKHIKQMKSKAYIQNLIRYPEMVEKLTLRYAPSDS